MPKELVDVRLHSPASPAMAFPDAKLASCCATSGNLRNTAVLQVLAHLRGLPEGGLQFTGLPLAIHGLTCRPVVTIGATNRPEVLDMALRRPGRFDREIDVGVPGTRARTQILKHCLKLIKNDVPEKDVEELAGNMHGFVAADIAALAQEAALQTLREYVVRKEAAEAEGRVVSMEDLDLCMHLSQLQHAATVIKPSALREVAIEVPKVWLL